MADVIVCDGSMDPFAVIVTVALVVAIACLLLVGKLADRGRVADLSANRPADADADAEVERRDLGQMVDATNDYRRRHGRPETSLAEVTARVEGEQLGRLEEAERRGRRDADRDR